MKKFKISNINVIKHDKAVQPHVMVNPKTGEQVEVTMQSEHDEYTEKGFVSAETQSQQPTQSQPQYKDGGKHKGDKMDKYENLTGEYISELPPYLLHKADSEVEKDEYLKFPNGEIREAEGESHENGGIDLKLPDGTKILSDHLKIGAKAAKELNKEHGLNIKSKDTYAQVLEKYNKKIGLEKLYDSQAELFKKLDEEDKTPDTDTKRVNLEYINSKILDIENKKKALGEERNMMFDKLFERQEASKPEQKKEFRFGGLSESKIKSIAKKHGVSMEKAMFLLGGEKGYYADGDEVKKATAPYEQKEAFGEQGIQRLNMLRKEVGLDPIPLTASPSEARAAAGEMQQAAIDKNPDLVADYMLSYSHRPTNKLLGILGEKGYSTEGKTDEELNTMLKEAYTKGDIASTDIATGFHDNLWHYRGLQTDLQEVSPEELAKIQEEQRAITVGDKTYYADPTTEGRYVEYTTKQGEPAADPYTAPDPTADITAADRSGIRYEEPKGFVFPDQSMLPPGALEPHLMTKARRGRIDPVKIGVEDQLTEINRQASSVQDQLAMLPPSQRAAALASVLATTQQSAGKAITNVNRLNAQQQQSAELFNIQQADVENQLQNANLLNFEQRQLTAKAKTDKDLRDYLEFNRNVALNNLRNQQTLNMIDILSPDYELDMFGNAIGYDPSYNFQLGLNQLETKTGDEEETK